MRPETVFENIYDLMRFGSTASLSEAGGVTTITTDNIYSLQNGMLVEVGSRVYPVSNIVRNSVNEWTFDINATGLTGITEWKLALYYEYGKALEINTTLKDQKDDPVNKNKRFPLMWLLTDIEKNEDFEIGYQAQITIAFIYLSEQNIKAKKRIETKMEPILDPLVTLFKNTIITSPGSRYFLYPFGTQLDLSQTDKFKYGSVANNAHVFDDITDAIQLDMNLRFNVDTENCNY